MKIRIKGNSVRLRLTKTEIDTFKATGFLKEETQFGTGTFFYALKRDESASELKANYSDNCITVLVPAAMHDEWTNSDVVGYENKYATTASTSLFILIEKDFVCLDNTFEDQSDNYPNPNAVC